MVDEGEATVNEVLFEEGLKIKDDDSEDEPETVEYLLGGLADL